MPRHKSDLIVPIRDRRRRRRIVTLSNFGKLAIALMIVFLAITIRSEMRGTGSRNYGRLLDRQIASDVKQKPVEVVREAQPPVPDQTVPDPMLVAPMAREQWLHDEMMPPAETAMTSQVIAPRAGRDSRVAIVGGPEGVAIVQQQRRKPVLSGGFGR